MVIDAWIKLFTFSAFAVPITLIDLREMRIPDVLSLGGIAITILLNSFLFHESPLSIIMQILIGFGVFWLIRQVTGGKLGLGDVKYSMLIALSIGLRSWLMTLVVASVTGLVCALYLMGFHKMEKTARIPFAPFLTLGAFVAIVMERLSPGMW